jgi:hypothetical protein
MRLWLYVAALAALAGAGLYLHHLQEKASRVDAAEARAEAAEKGRADDMREVVRRLDESATERKALAARLEAIDKRFDAIKLPDPKVLIQTREVPGACPVTGVSDEFVRLYNQTAEP